MGALETEKKVKNVLFPAACHPPSRWWKALHLAGKQGTIKKSIRNCGVSSRWDLLRP